MKEQILNRNTTTQSKLYYQKYKYRQISACYDILSR